MLAALITIGLSLPSHAAQGAEPVRYSFNDFNLEIFKGWQPKTKLKKMVKAEAANLEVSQLIQRYIALNEEYKGRFVIFYDEKRPRVGEGIFMALRIGDKTFSLTKLSTPTIEPDILDFYKTSTDRQLDLQRVYSKYAVSTSSELEAGGID